MVKCEGCQLDGLNLRPVYYECLDKTLYMCARCEGKFSDFEKVSLCHVGTDGNGRMWTRPDSARGVRR